MAFDYDQDFIGIIQRGYIVDITGNRTKVNTNGNIPKIAE